LIWPGKRNIAISFVAATLVPIGVLTWFGVRVLQMDRDVERQRTNELLKISAQKLALELKARFGEIEDRLRRTDGLQFTIGGIRAAGTAPLLYQPQAPADSEIPAEAFTKPQFDEHQRGDFAAAALSYRELSRSPQPAIRAAALAGLGRVLRRKGDHAESLEVYSELETYGNVVLLGEPAALIARHGKLRVLKERGSLDELHRHTAELARLLDEGRWPVDRATYETYRGGAGHVGLLAEWGAPPSPAEGIARTAIAVRMWHEWRSGELTPQGQAFFREEQTQIPILGFWSGTDQPTAWLATPMQLRELLESLASSQGLTIRVDEPDGREVLGRAPPLEAISLTPGDTKLPFLLTVAPSDGPSTPASDRMRRTVLIAGLLGAFLLILAAVYSLYRSTARELALAKLQSDFVSAVSHEFRTPLTSLRHLTDLLATRGVTSEERKVHYYALLSHETERLHRLVEGLLSFGRIEAGAYAWKLKRIDAGELIQNIAQEFRGEPLASGREICCDIEAHLPSILGDKEALSRALWNLLENAAKYSEPGLPIRAFARNQPNFVVLGVEDQGGGIPATEREKIFEKFVRGADARRSGMRGVGIGLALVKRIAEAHNGSVRLESEIGKGSTFTILLPEVKA
jgi:signal transduction histidine kinase